MIFYKIHYFCKHFLEFKRFYHDRIQNYLSKIISKECDLSKWDHTKDKPTETVTTFHKTFILGVRGEEDQSQQVKKPRTSLLTVVEINTKLNCKVQNKLDISNHA